MKSKSFYIIIAWLSVISALMLHSISWNLVDQASHLRAKSIFDAQASHSPVKLDPRSGVLWHQAKTTYQIGCVLLVLGLICIITARARKEPGWYLLLILFLFFDLMLLMIP